MRENKEKRVKMSRKRKGVKVSEEKGGRWRSDYE